MISVAQAHAAIAALVRVLPSETVPLQQASGRVLRRPAAATLNQPPFTASAMDGYAIRAADKVPGQRLAVVGEVAAGGWSETVIRDGEALRIFTGAPMPAGAEVVLIQEDAQRLGDEITLGYTLDDAHYVRPAGGDFAKGAEMEAPRRLSAADIGLLAAMNVPKVEVGRLPEVAIVPTGDELVALGETPGNGQILCSSAHSVAALLARAGARTRILPIAPDTPEGLGNVLALADGADLVITLGGASVGDHDLVQSTAGSRGLKLDFYKIRMRPGKPLICGTLGEALFLGLPGNPVSSMVCAQIFALPLLAAMQGLAYAPPLLEQGTLVEPIGTNGGREHYMRAVAHYDDGWKLRVLDRQDSSLLSVLSQANALVVRPPKDESRPAGDKVQFLRIG